jgi:hypothetical protein
MKKLILLFALLAAGCAGMQKAPPVQTMSITKVIEVPGMTGGELFDKTYEWVGRNLQIDSADKSTGTILADGEVGYPFPDPNRSDYTIVFSMKNEIRGDRNDITFGNIMLKFSREYISEAYTVQSYTGGEETPITSGRDYQAARNALGQIANNLSNYLKGTVEPLYRCATCGAIFTSPDCLTEHLKHHPGHKAEPGK